MKYSRITDQMDLRYGDVIYHGTWFGRNRHIKFHFRKGSVPNTRKHRGSYRHWKGNIVQRWRLEVYEFDEEIREMISSSQESEIDRTFQSRNSLRDRNYWDDVPKMGNKNRSWKHCTHRNKQYKI